ncbi:MAG: tRNA (adenine(22)-N(1))-methyltransferase TrmK, partial [Carnobacterium alterfunditum]
MILQPNIGEKTLREWLVAHCYTVTAEELIKKNDKIYELMVAEKDPSKKPTATVAQLTFGFYLKDENSAIFKKKWQKELEKNRRILGSLTKSSTDQTILSPFMQIEKVHKIQLFRVQHGSTVRTKM